MILYDHMQHIDDEPSIEKKIERLYKAYQDPSLVKHRAYILFRLQHETKVFDDRVRENMDWIKATFTPEMQRCFSKADINSTIFSCL